MTWKYVTVFDSKNKINEIRNEETISQQAQHTGYANVMQIILSQVMRWANSGPIWFKSNCFSDSLDKFVLLINVIAQSPIIFKVFDRKFASISFTVGVASLPRYNLTVEAFR